MKGIERKAFIFAKRAHESIDQRRKYTGEPYIVHPVAVARDRQFRKPPLMLAGRLSSWP